MPPEQQQGESYVCVQVPNVPGVLGRVASCLGQHEISIKRVYQDTGKNQPAVDLVVITESARDADVVAALAELAALDEIVGTPQRLRIIPAPPAD